jgi:hypothetical protein
MPITSLCLAAADRLFDRIADGKSVKDQQCRPGCVKRIRRVDQDANVVDGLLSDLLVEWLGRVETVDRRGAANAAETEKDDEN